MRSIVSLGFGIVAVATAAACYQTTQPPPGTVITTTGADMNENAWAKDGGIADDNVPPGRSPGTSPGVGVTGAPMGHPTPWRGAGAGGSR